MKVSNKFNYLASCPNNYAANILSVLLLGKPLQEKYNLNMRRTVINYILQNIFKSLHQLEPCCLLRESNINNQK